ncbi:MULTISPECIES: peptidylprolyl isomerase [unclassified Tolypothrix]|uniref:peptidylprolyl isomerase n=1 Tax=unclassified Tolypothrix TaxID=2649714 RepID=UPI0005EAC7F5|nr:MULTISPECIES: peptidylprolyl isomerase [unclassified Tolypothrix]BAY89416.1 PpiC-type peptidyl-prolyl cis-trans isomerase [Microchaete diplosiphon NIES-3275]EKF01860.1 putative peptidyl-prolyl isomerase [Tolypothrix sp. PCC 7601]MBE9086149.1 peptidylprolyl isomerase [Tolypothrix sp. LEGE 11397]UYD23705.1 peptidylprolyl isomerase [Tolypothrix sp. PCC 7712]UYD34071.1 peptidylprolyl isomerase [Tolypothrix sp. PCC 7601]
MSQTITISNQDILHIVKQYRQIPDLIEKIITHKIIETTVSEIGIQVETEELQEAADNFRLMNALETSEDTWKWLDKHALSLDDFEELVYHNLLANKLAQHLFADKVEPYFFENQLEYAGAVIYEVILDDEDLAMELFYAIKEGETSFYDVAHQYTQDSELRRKCGYRGKVNRQDLKPEISAAVFAANSPQLLKPIITSKGVHLIMLEEIIQPELSEKLRYQIMSDFFVEWIKQQMNKFEIIKFLE